MTDPRNQADDVDPVEQRFEELGARGITHANPGIEKTCLVTECDDIHTEMNISRSDLVDSEKTVEFKHTLGELLGELERYHGSLALSKETHRPNRSHECSSGRLSAPRSAGMATRREVFGHV